MNRIFATRDAVILSSGIAGTKDLSCSHSQDLLLQSKCLVRITL